MDAERQTLEVFVVPNRRDRWITGLDNPKRRRKILDRLCHHDDWRTNLARTTAPTGRRPEHLAALLAELRALGPPAVCHVMSERADCEARSMPLPEALEALSDDGCALLVCLPGVLALHLPEAPAPPVILSVQAWPRSGVATS